MKNILAETMENELVVDDTTSGEYPDVLTPESLAFVAELEREFRTTRARLLADRLERQKQIDSGQMPDFLRGTKFVRDDRTWSVGNIPEDLQRRRVEITGPVERKMMINALNSGADVFMADFEDANAPTWANVLQGHRNLRDAVNKTIAFTSPEGKQYRLNEKVATLLVRPRGWHLSEKHVIVDGRPMSASLFDFGMYFFHQARPLLESGSGPYFYLPKLESHREARLWNSVFEKAQDVLGIPRGTIKATVLIETILAAFEMDEIVYELREHIVGLNAGRWDYLFSVIKKFRNRPGFLLPDRAQLTMAVPFMRAYTDLLVRTCHNRGAHAIGGMAAFIPSRRDAGVNATALSKVTEDKVRESAGGFDGTWVAHPDLVPVALKPFDAVLGSRPHQKDANKGPVETAAAELLNFNIPDSSITEAGLRNNISVGIQYLESWLRGIGAVGIFNLMEDAATAEISRSQVWQWMHNPAARLSDGRTIDISLYRTILDDELLKLEAMVGRETFTAGKYRTAADLFNRLVAEEEYEEFLTLGAYNYLE